MTEAARGMHLVTRGDTKVYLLLQKVGTAMNNEA